MEPIIDGVIRELDAYQIYNIVSFEVDEKDFQVKTILAKSRGEFWDKALSGGLIFEGCLVNIKKQIEKLLRQLNKRSYTYKTSYENEIEIYFQYIANINLNINDTNEVIFMKILSELIMNQNPLFLKQDEIKSDIFVKYHEMLDREHDDEEDDDEEDDDEEGESEDYKKLKVEERMICTVKCVLRILLKFFCGESKGLLDFFVNWNALESVFNQYNDEIWNEYITDRDHYETIMNNFEQIKVLDVKILN